MAAHQEWLRAALDHTGMSQAELARRISPKVPSAIDHVKINKVLRGIRKLTHHEIIAISDVLAVPLPDADVETTVPMVGYVGAGASATMFNASQEELDRVEAPRSYTAQTVAVKVVGDSMLPMAEDGWLLYYDDRREPVTDDLIGRLCVVGLRNGTTLVKRLRRGNEPGRFTLISTNAGVMENVPIEWAAKVTWIQPR
jgi:SOS-response transcriptional repressor LexA